MERAAAAATRRAAAAGITGLVTRAARSLWGKFWQQLGYSSSGGGGGGCRAASGGLEAAGAHTAISGATAIHKNLWFDMPTDLLEQQVYYVLADSKRFKQISDMIDKAYISQGVLLSAARQGLFDDQPSSASAAAAARSSGPGDISQGPHVTLFDVVAAGSDSEVLYDAVSAGVGQLWRSLTGGS